MEKVYITRFKALIKHLRTGKLGHEVFDFSSFNYTRGDKNSEPYKCGTNGCAIGEMPIINKKWIFDADNLPVLKKYSLKVLKAANEEDLSQLPRVSKSMQEWFGITEQEADLLFIPYPDRPLAEKYNLKRLSGDASQFQVADNLETFLAYKIKQ